MDSVDVVNLEKVLELASKYNVTGMTIGGMSFTRMVDFDFKSDFEGDITKKDKEYIDPTEALARWGMEKINLDRDPEA